MAAKRESFQTSPNKEQDGLPKNCGVSSNGELEIESSTKKRDYLPLLENDEKIRVQSTANINQNKIDIGETIESYLYLEETFSQEQAGR
jgi:hypothetical protein